MNSRVLFFALVLIISACGFNPDLSRFDECTPEGACPSGFLCLTQENRCVPACGESCPAPMVDAGVDAGMDAGIDAGVDAGIDAGTDAGADAGEDAGVDAGMDAGEEDAGLQLALAAMNLPAAIETKPYAFAFVPTGGSGTYTFLIDGGVPGFTLDVSGQLTTSAAPTPGTFPFTITVRDSATEVTTGFQLEVRPFLRVANSQLLDGRTGQPYADQLSATGGQPPFTWDLVVDGGSPPAGVMLLADGGVRGAPSAAGSVSFFVNVTDSATPPQQATRAVRIDTVGLNLGLLSLATPAARDARRGTAYAQQLKSYGGNQAGVTWTILPGGNALPPGLSLTSATTDGLISGTPSLAADAGVYSFSVRCRDGVLGDVTQAMSITVY